MNKNTAKKKLVISNKDTAKLKQKLSDTSLSQIQGGRASLPTPNDFE